MEPPIRPVRSLAFNTRMSFFDEHELGGLQQINHELFARWSASRRTISRRRPSVCVAIAFFKSPEREGHARRLLVDLVAPTCILLQYMYRRRAVVFIIRNLVRSAASSTADRRHDGPDGQRILLTEQTMAQVLRVSRNHRADPSEQQRLLRRRRFAPFDPTPLSQLPRDVRRPSPSRWPGAPQRHDRVAQASLSHLGAIGLPLRRGRHLAEAWRAAADEGRADQDGGVRRRAAATSKEEEPLRHGEQALLRDGRRRRQLQHDRTLAPLVAPVGATVPLRMQLTKSYFSGSAPVSTACSCSSSCRVLYRRPDDRDEAQVLGRRLQAYNMRKWPYIVSFYSDAYMFTRRFRRSGQFGRSIANTVLMGCLMLSRVVEPRRSAVEHWQAHGRRRLVQRHADAHDALRRLLHGCVTGCAIAGSLGRGTHPHYRDVPRHEVTVHSTARRRDRDRRCADLLAVLRIGPMVRGVFLAPCRWVGVSDGADGEEVPVSSPQIVAAATDWLRSLPPRAMTKPPSCSSLRSSQRC